MLDTKLQTGPTAGTAALTDSPPTVQAPAADVRDRLVAAGLDVRPFPTLDEVGTDQFHAVIAQRRPVLVHGLIEDWPARAGWIPPRLVERHGDMMVRALMDLPGNGVLFPKDQSCYERTLPFAEFLATMLTASPAAPCYLAYQRPEEIFPPADYDCDALLGAHNTAPDTRVWIGSAGTRSLLHSDLKDNVFCQLYGEKSVVLAPWADSPAVYPFPDNIVNSQVDLASPDLEKFPRLRRIVLYAGTAGPGDVLFIPRGWWHDIRSRTPSVSLNHWFGEPLGSRDYLRLIGRLGPAYWAATVRDFVRYGLLGHELESRFFFTPPATGKRLFDALRWGDFSRDNDPSK